MSVKIRIRLKDLPCLHHLDFAPSADSSVFLQTDWALGVSRPHEGCTRNQALSLPAGSLESGGGGGEDALLEGGETHPTGEERDDV